MFTWPGLEPTCTKPSNTLQWCPSGPWWRLFHETACRWCATWSRSLWPCGHCRQRAAHIWWWAATQQSTGNGSEPGPSLWCWRQPEDQSRGSRCLGCEGRTGRARTATALEPHGVQRSCSSHVRQESDLQHVEQEILVVNTVDSVQEQHHGGLVVRDKAGWHLWFNYAVVWKNIWKKKTKTNI